VADVRWFGLNEYEHLIVPDLQRCGLEIATTGDARAKVALVMNHDLAPSAWRYARRHRIDLISYVWDLPPFRLGEGGPDHIVPILGHLVTLPRLGPRYATRRGYYSRLRFVARRAAAVWTPSVASAAAVARRFDVATEPVPYCYDSRLFTPDTHSANAGPGPTPPSDPDRLTLLSVSRLTPPKNHAAVVRAAATLGAHVEFVGTGPEKTALEALAGHLGVPCSFRSRLSGQELRATYRRATVVVCPSRFEGLGLTGIEAAICGTPVVASDIPAHREFLGPAAHFFTLDDDATLVDAIGRARAAGAPPTAHLARLTIDAAARRFFDRLRSRLQGGT
jgi:glycosyltransferase involved in cell wall biosynthesis